MARIMDDRARGHMLSRLIQQHMGSEDSSIAATAPEYQPRGKMGLDQPVAAETDDELERMYPPDRNGRETGPPPDRKQNMNHMPADPSMNQAQVADPRELDGRGLGDPNELSGEYESGNPSGAAPPPRSAPSGQQDAEMVTMPKSLAYSAMDKLMQSASRNAISKSAPEQQMADNLDVIRVPNSPYKDSGEGQDFIDANGEMPARMIKRRQEDKDNADPSSNEYNGRRRGPVYQKTAMNDGGDPTMANKMRRMPLASDTTTNEDDWQNGVNYQGSAVGARAAGVIGKKANSNRR